MIFKKGNSVVMHSCMESKPKENYGKIWICECDSFERGGSEKVFLVGFSGSFCCEFLQLVNVYKENESQIKDIFGNQSNFCKFKNGCGMRVDAGCGDCEEFKDERGVTCE